MRTRPPSSRSWPTTVGSISRPVPGVTISTTSSSAPSRPFTSEKSLGNLHYRLGTVQVEESHVIHARRRTQSRTGSAPQLRARLHRHGGRVRARELRTNGRLVHGVG